MTNRDLCECGHRTHTRQCAAYLPEENGPACGCPGTCNCWVRLRPADERFGIRYGAHNPDCPRFHPSRDPVDAVADAELRMRYEVGIASVGAIVITKESHPEAWAVLERPVARDCCVDHDSLECLDQRCCRRCPTPELDLSPERGE